MLSLRVSALVAVGAAMLSPSSHHVTASHAPVWGPDEPFAPQIGAGGFHMKLYNIQDDQYYAKMQVGSPGQSVRMGFDTFSSDLGVLAIKSQGHLFYNHSASSTYQPDGRAVTLDDGTSGVLGIDRVIVHEDAVVTNQFFTEITNVSVYDKYFVDLRVDGWVGLARSSTQTVGQVPTLVKSLIDKKLISAPFVGLWMPMGENGEITFGQPTDVTTQQLTYVDTPVGKKNRLWGFDVSKIDVGGTPIDSPATPTGGMGFGALSTVNPFIIGPPAAVQSIYKAVGATKVTRWIWQVPCHATLPNITFWAGETGLITLTQRELVGFPLSETGCMLQITAWSPNDKPEADWVLGLPAFHRYFIGCFYDDLKPRLGLALGHQ